jgi:hypothetical protein
MRADELSAAELEAWRQVQEAEQALEIAQLNLWAITDQQGRPQRGHLRVIEGDEPCDPRR